MKIKYIGALIVMMLSTVTAQVSAEGQDNLSKEKADLPFSIQQDTPEADGAFSNRTATLNNCFDYYTFGSVQLDITTTLANTVSGVPVTFKGIIKNTNNYPIVDGTLYVKVFKLRESAEKNVNGPHVVGQYVVLNQLSLPAKGSMPVQFSWKAPANATTGDYQLATFFTTSKKFNLLGLAFTDDVVGNTVNFHITGETTKGVVLDKDTVTISDDTHTQDYYFAAFPPRMSATSSVTVNATIKNTTNEDQRSTVSWNIYQWDQQRRENRIETVTNSYIVKANSIQNITHIVKNNDYPVYLAVATLKYKDTKSILNIRFVREDKSKLRINFPGITNFPLKKGKETTLFSCLHNTANATPDGELTLTLEDLNGDIIHEYAYKGGVTGAMMGIKDTFMPKKDYDRFILKAELSQEGRHVDSAYLKYDCMQIEPSTCSRLVEDESGHIVYGELVKNNFLQDLFIKYFWATLAVSIVLIISIILFLWRKLR